MTAILMTPHTMPSRFSVAEDAETSPVPPQPARSLAARLAAATAWLRRTAASAPGRHASSAAAW